MTQSGAKQSFRKDGTVDKKVDIVKSLNELYKGREVETGMKANPLFCDKESKYQVYVYLWWEPKFSKYKHKGL